MNRQEALRTVAGHMAALMSASTLEENTGIDQSVVMSEADEERLEWAVEEVERRLFAMGEPRPRRSASSRRT